MLPAVPDPPKISAFFDSLWIRRIFSQGKSARVRSIEPDMKELSDALLALDLMPEEVRHLACNPTVGERYHWSYIAALRLLRHGYPYDERAAVPGAIWRFIRSAASATGYVEAIHS
jgi:hypothetical protein